MIHVAHIQLRWYGRCRTCDYNTRSRTLGTVIALSSPRVGHRRKMFECSATVCIIARVDSAEYIRDEFRGYRPLKQVKMLPLREHWHASRDFPTLIQIYLVCYSFLRYLTQLTGIFLSTESSCFRRLLVYISQTICIDVGQACHSSETRWLHVLQVSSPPLANCSAPAPGNNKYILRVSGV